MKQPIQYDNFNDTDGNPAGGYVDAIGLSIDWQDGPLGKGLDRKEPNGCFVETVIAAAIQRLEYYQQSKFACSENALALTYLKDALTCLEARTAGREKRDVEGTHEI